jgi:FkbM family methyltransferase
VPVVLIETYRTVRALDGTSPGSAIRRWLRACRPAVRNAVRSCRFDLLPPALRHPLGLVLDVGACQGEWLASLMRLVPVEKAFVIEPNPAMMQRCRRRFAECPGITFYQAACGEARTSATLHIARSPDFSSLLPPATDFINQNYSGSPAGVERDLTVDVLPLDELALPDQPVDIFKLDVQGAEERAIAGARRVLQRTRALLIEINFHSHYEGASDFSSMFRLLTSDLGMRLWSISEIYRAPSGAAMYADALFLNPSVDSGDNRS